MRLVEIKEACGEGKSVLINPDHVLFVNECYIIMVGGENTFRTAHTQDELKELLSD